MGGQLVSALGALVLSAVGGRRLRSLPLGGGGAGPFRAAADRLAAARNSVSQINVGGFIIYR